MFEAFVAGLLLITVSELGDKSFFIAMIMAGRYSRFLVFIGVTSALVVMTLLSVGMGHVLTFLPVVLVRVAEIVLFLVFGLKLLLQARRMPSGQPGSCEDACQEAIDTIKQVEQNIPQPTQMGILLQTFGMTFLAEWGDRTQIATIGLAATKHNLGVTLGVILGHAICAVIAILGGKLIASHISEKMLTLSGGLLFLVFALVGLVKLGWSGA